MTDVQREDLIKYSKGSIYKLVILASKRALELKAGAQKLIEETPGKTAAIVFEEIRQGKVRIKENG